MIERQSRSKSKEPDERTLDRALEQTFPASDAAPRHSITGTEPLESDPNRKAPRITSQEADDAAQETIECPHCCGTGRLVRPSDC